MIARTLLTEPVLCRLDHATADERVAMRRGQPNFFLPFDRAGIDPFTDLFGITLLAEGTVRGTGGLALASPACDTAVPGLYAVGNDQASVMGGHYPAGGINIGPAMAFGYVAGRDLAGVSAPEAASDTAASQA